MDELSRWVAEARAHVEVPWDAAREARIRARVDGERRRPRRRALVPALAAAAVVGSAAAAWAWVATDAGGGPSVGTAPGSLTLADGSRIDVEGPDGRVTVLAERPQETTVRLEAGAARFDVVPRARRRFRVRARDVEVAVIGTVFEVVDRRSTVEVRVLRGRVRVAWAGGQEVLSAPARGLYPDQGGERSPRAGPDPRAAATGRSAARAPGARPGAEAAARLAARGVDPGSGGAEGGAGSVAPTSGARSQAWSAEAPAPRPPGPGEDRPGSRAPPAARPTPTGSSSEAGRPSTSDAPASPSWEDLAREGRYDRAFEALARHGGITAVPDRPAALMLAADVARLSRHPEDALAPLEGVVARHARDPRAPLAAFTLGRVLLEELGRPRPAAEAFARARRLAPAGSLAEDALAREVEAWSRAGEAARARRLAEDYVARYPRGRRLSSTRRFGGLD